MICLLVFVLEITLGNTPIMARNAKIPAAITPPDVNPAKARNHVLSNVIARLLSAAVLY